jgi:hypothetical protein
VALEAEGQPSDARIVQSEPQYSARTVLAFWSCEQLVHFYMVRYEAGGGLGPNHSHHRNWDLGNCGCADMLYKNSSPQDSDPHHKCA